MFSKFFALKFYSRIQFISKQKKREKEKERERKKEKERERIVCTDCGGYRDRRN